MALDKQNFVTHARWRMFLDVVDFGRRWDIGNVGMDLLGNDSIAHWNVWNDTIIRTYYSVTNTYDCIYGTI